jgi:hypothetical protein
LRLSELPSRKLIRSKMYLPATLFTVRYAPQGERLHAVNPNLVRALARSPSAEEAQGSRRLSYPVSEQCLER